MDLSGRRLSKNIYVGSRGRGGGQTGKTPSQVTSFRAWGENHSSGGETGGCYIAKRGGGDQGGGVVIRSRLLRFQGWETWQGVLQAELRIGARDDGGDVTARGNNHRCKLAKVN